MLTELRFAARRLLADGWPTTAAVLAVTLGAGLSIAVFSAAYGILLRPLVYERADRLAVIDASTPFAQVEDWRRHLTTFERVAAYAREGVVVIGVGDARLARVAYVDEWFFDTISIRPVAGRLLARGDVDAAVVSERFARSAAASPQAATGQRLTAGGAALTVAGVLPDAYAFPAEDVDIWIPAANARPVAIDRFEDARRWRLVGLLRADASLAAARADVERASAALQPDGSSRAGDTPAVELLQARVTRSARPIVLLFAGAAVLVCLVTCANLATILIGRAVARRREVAICTALGAGRGRIAAGMLSEAMLLALAGTAGGVLLASVAVRVVTSWAQEAMPRSSEAGVGLASLVFAVLLALALAAIAAAWTLPAVRRTTSGLRAGGASATQHDRRLRGVLLTAQIALVVVLLSGGGLLVRTMAGLLRTDLGLDGRGALVSQLVLTSATTFRADTRWPLVRDLVLRVQALPDVRAAGVGSSLPPATAQLEISVSVAGETGERMHRFSLASVTPGYLEAIGARLLQGRHFAPRDLDAAGPLVVISESAARAVMRQPDVAGRELPFALPGQLRERGHPTVVGVVADVRYAGLETDPGPAIYVLWPEVPLGQGYLAVRTSGRTHAGTVADIRTIMRELDPSLPHTPVQTLDEIVRRGVADRGLAARLGATLALLTFGVALAGLSGSVMRAVEERRRELAIRGALGASPSGLVRLVLSDVALFAGGGLALGLCGALVMSGLLRSLIHGVGAYDAPMLAGVTLSVVAGSLLACYPPARRAARVDPAAVLRE